LICGDKHMNDFEKCKKIAPKPRTH
jgi:hypothetical protein